MAPVTELAQTPETLKEKFRRIFGRDAGLGYALVLPMLIVVIGLLAYPFGNALYLSLTKKSLGMPAEFIGLGNYVELLTDDPRFLKVAANSLIYTIFGVAGKLFLGMVMALVLNADIKARGFFRGLLLVPWVMPTVVTALTWRWLFDATFGVINYILKNLHIITSPIAWLASKQTAMMVVISANVWRGFPFFGISLLAGLQAIPQELYEAAEIDGASAWERFVHITLPSLRAVTVVATLLSTIWTFNDFVLPWVTTGTGPSDATNIFGTYTYQLGFLGSRLGYAIAATAIMLPFLVVFILLLAPLMWRED